MDANERLKRRADSATWGGIAVATVLHFLVFAFSPTWTAEVEATTVEPPTVVSLDEIPIPPAPEEILAPAKPVPVPGLPEEVTIAPDPGPGWIPDAVAPPPSGEGRAEEGLPWTPMTTPPRLANPDQVARRLEREYPPVLRDAGLGGTVTLHVHLDDRGRVLEVRTGASSGVEALDRAALAVAEAFRFTPALNRDRRVAVWIALPVTFRAR